MRVCHPTALAFCLTVTRYLCTRPFAVSRPATLNDKSWDPEDEPSKSFTSIVAGCATTEALVVEDLL